MAVILNPDQKPGYRDDDWLWHKPTIIGRCSACSWRIEVEKDETQCPECGAEFNIAPKEMLTAKYLCV